MARLLVTACPGTAPWVVRPEHRLALEQLLSADVRVTYAPRAALLAIWRRRHPRGPDPDPYAFRAFTTPDQRTVLFVDATETYDSALWLLVHELAHADLVQSRLLATSLRQLRARDPRYLVDDDAHEADPEERVANAVADAVVRHLGRPPGLDRRWWRRRTVTVHGP